MKAVLKLQTRPDCFTESFSSKKVSAFMFPAFEVYIHNFKRTEYSGNIFKTTNLPPRKEDL